MYRGESSPQVFPLSKLTATDFNNITELLSHQNVTANVKADNFYNIKKNEFKIENKFQAK